MDKFKQIETFVNVAQRGSLTAAARLEGVAPGVIGRRIDALEHRLGVKLLLRTTRRLSLTFEGAAFLEDCQRVLDALGDAESAVSMGGARPRGHLRVTAPAGFGRRHVAPLLPEFLSDHPELTVSLELSDRLADIVNESIDIAIRIGALPDSSLVGTRLADNRRVVVGSPEYFARRGEPRHPSELASHDCLTFGNYGNQSRGWQFVVDGRPLWLRVGGSMECNDGAALLEWARAGHGLAWRSMWEVRDDIRRGMLRSVLNEFPAPDSGVFALFAQRRQMPLRVRMFVDFLRERYAAPDYWR
ncbi:MAG: LysR family transcriptional regulator [Burkholderiaceae bacterium]